MLRAVARQQIEILLVGQGLDGGGVEGLETLGQCQVDGEFADNGLARARGRGDQHALAAFERFAPAHLEIVEREVVGIGEAGELTAGGGLSASGSGIAFGGRAHEISLRVPSLGSGTAPLSLSARPTSSRFDSQPGSILRPHCAPLPGAAAGRRWPRRPPWGAAACATRP